MSLSKLGKNRLKIDFLVKGAKEDCLCPKCCSDQSVLIKSCCSNKFCLSCIHKLLYYSSNIGAV